jgi:hypothetical protein
MRTRNLAAITAVLFYVHGISGAFPAEIIGDIAPHGHGTVSSYVVTGDGGAPAEIGIVFSAGALDGLPERRNNTSRCFDLDGNGAINVTGECEGDYSVRLAFPAEITSRTDIPFVFAMVNWNPEGHPPEPWAPPHFDIHFYQIPESAVDAMRVGPCGIFMNCDDFQRAIKPVPAKYVHPEHASVEAAVGQMGNHLIDTMTPELGTPPKPFTHTWMFGADDGRIIFHEVMATRALMALGPDSCHDIKQPEAWEKAGYYPTRYCFRHGGDGSLKVLMEGFVLRPAD